MATFDAIEYLVDGGSAGEPFQLGDEILLQRLPIALGATLKLGVHLLWEVSDKHVWHACIMLSLTVEDNPSVRKGSAVNSPTASLEHTSHEVPLGAIAQSVHSRSGSGDRCAGWPAVDLWATSCEWFG